jgi:hypothetical protein
MDIDQKIRSSFPIFIAEMYELAELETNEQLKVQNWIDLFQEIMRYLSLVGLALYRENQIVDERVEQERKHLNRPSLGHWMKLFVALEKAFSEKSSLELTSPLIQKFHNNVITKAVNGLHELIGNEPPDTIRLLHLLKALVEFRNKRIGHGRLTDKEAHQAIQLIKPAILFWLEHIPILETSYLLYIHNVEWHHPHFVFIGTKNQGKSLYAVRLEREEKTNSRRVYLVRSKEDQSDSFIPLNPYIFFDNSQKKYYIFTEISTSGNLLLKCSYRSGEANTSMEIEADTSLILGSERAEEDIPQTIDKLQEQEVEFRQKDSTMKPWYEIITPHEDIQKGQLDESVFHVDLGDVASGIAPDDYKDPYLFYKKTYLTKGIENLLQKVASTLTEGTGSSVIQIQTPFGGGKTHSLVAIYHYIKNGESIRDLLPKSVPILEANISAISGNHWDVINGEDSDGINRKTLWGDMAFQVAGESGYEVFRETDEARIAPGKEKLRSFLEEHQPFVLLFDEILEYINRALDRKLELNEEGVSLGKQTFSFFQELTEAVSTISNGMMIVTLPSSYLEDFSDKTEESLARLNKIFGRVESIETPVHGEEVYEVIRRRLFQIESLQKTDMLAVVHQFFQTYKQNRDDLPTQVRDVTYRNKMEKAYPFHPSVIDLLYEKWSTFSSFQRTRGVLRLLANIVEDLYKREIPVSMILPGDINLDHPSIRHEFLNHIGLEYEGVIGSDIAGHEAKAYLLDRDNRSWDHLAQRISTAIFYHSFSADEAEKGVTLPYIKLATMRPDSYPSLIFEVLNRLTHFLWYLNTRGDSYYFSDIPNLNRMIMDKKELFNESYEHKLKEIVEGEIQNHFRTYLWPDNGDGIPDNRDLKLVVFHPDDSEQQIPQWLERKGETFREYKNTLFFALADTAAFAQFRDDVKKLLALEEIKDEIRSGKSPLPDEKRSEVDRQIHSISRDFSYKVRRMYHRLYHGERVIDLGTPTAGAESLSHWFWRELTSDNIGAILTRLHYRVLVNKFLKDTDQIATSVLLDQFYKDVNLPVPESEGVVARAIQLGIEDGAFGLVEILEDQVQSDSLKYKMQVPFDAISFSPDTLLISKERSEKIYTDLKEKEGEGLPVIGEIGAGSPPEETEKEIEGPGEPADKEKEKRYHRVRLVIGDIPAGRIADVNRGILLPFARTTGDFSFTLEIDVSDEDGFSESMLVNQVKETIRQIGGRIIEEEFD